MSLLQQTTRISLSARSILAVQKRFSTREEIHRYVEPNKFKKHMLAASQPYYRKTFSPPRETCKGIPNTEYELLPIEKIYVKELLEELEASNFVLLIQYNYTNFLNDRVYRNTLTKCGGKFLTYNNRIYREVFKSLGQEPNNYLFVTKSALVTGRIESLPACVMALKKMSTFLLIGGFIDNHLHDLDMLTAISQSSDMDQCRANLVSTLETPAVELASIIERHGELLPDQDKDI